MRWVLGVGRPRRRFDTVAMGDVHSGWTICSICFIMLKDHAILYFQPAVISCFMFDVLLFL